MTIKRINDKADSKACIIQYAQPRNSQIYIYGPDDEKNFDKQYDYSSSCSAQSLASVRNVVDCPRKALGALLRAFSHEVRSWLKVMGDRFGRL